MNSSPSTRPAVQRPLLSVHSPVLTFPGARVGQPRYQVLTVAQQDADTPVTLTTDNPDFFQLASDAQPRFAPNLTLTPPPEGVHIHVRYLANRPGPHVGQLLIQSPYDTQAVTLQARTGGLVSEFLPGRPGQASKPPGQGARSYRASLAAVILLSGLLLTAYVHRCRLAPGLCQGPSPAVVQEKAAGKAVTTPALSATPAAPAASGQPTEKRRSYPGRFPPRRTAEATQQTTDFDATEGQTRLSGAGEIKGNEAVDRRVEQRPEEPRATRRTRRRREPEAAPSEVSDLEWELNRNPND